MFSEQPGGAGMATRGGAMNRLITIEYAAPVQIGLIRVPCRAVPAAGLAVVDVQAHVPRFDTLPDPIDRPVVRVDEAIEEALRVGWSVRFHDAAPTPQVGHGAA